MVLKDVKISDISEIRGRLGRIDTKKGQFKTPTRGLMNTELRKFFQANRTLREASDFFDNPFLEIVIDLDRFKISKLQSKSGNFENKIRSIKKDKATYDKGPVICFPRLKKEVLSLSETDINVIIELQGDSQVIDLAGIPDPRHGNYSVEFENIFRRAAKKLVTRYPDIYPVPFIRLDQDGDVVKRKINWLQAQGFKMISFIIIGDSKAGEFAVRNTLSEVEDIWVHLTNINKQFKKDVPVGVVNLKPLDYFDTVSSRKGYGGGGKTGESDRFAEVVNLTEWIPSFVTTKEDKVKRFACSTLGFLTKKEYIMRKGKQPDCSCPLCKGSSIDDFYDKLRLFKDEGIPLTVHEVFSSTNEIEGPLTTSIKKDLQEDYLRSKPTVIEFQKYFPEYITPKIKQLNDY